MSARERFEAAYATNGCTWHWSGSPQSPCLVMDCGTVIPHGVEWRQWHQSWQAARAEALEEARQACDERAAESRRMEAVCDSKERVWTDRDLQDEVTTEAAACAADIRALKDKEPA